MEIARPRGDAAVLGNLDLDDRREIRRFAGTDPRRWREVVATSLACAGWSLAMMTNVRVEPYHEWLRHLIEGLDKPDLVDQLAAGILPQVAQRLGTNPGKWRVFAMATLRSRDWSYQMIGNAFGISKQRVRELLVTHGSTAG